MAIPGTIFDHSTANFAGLTATNAMAVEGIKSGDNLLAVIAWEDDGSAVDGQDISDFTVGAGTITAGTIDLSGKTGVAIWTNAPAT